MTRTYWFILLLFTLFSCAGNDPQPEKKQSPEKQPQQAVEEISTLFNEDRFSEPEAEELLRELHICSDSLEVKGKEVKAPCSPKFFRFFKLRDNLPLMQGFLLQVRSNVGGIAIRRLLVFERENGQLVKVNGFTANLIRRISTKTAYDDLVLRFPDRVEYPGSDVAEIVFYNCLFSWDGSKYVFKSVEDIEGKDWGGPVKASLKDSMSVEIHAILKDNNMIF